MKNTWESVLKEKGIEIKEYCINNDNPSAFPLSMFAILEITGNDRYAFLQNQFTNDLDNNKFTSQLSAWCNPKGKVIANFVIINTKSSYLLIFKKDLKDYVFKKLNMYILRSKVTINDISNLYLLLGLSNLNKLELNNSSILLEDGDVKFINKQYITRLPDFSGRYLIAGNTKSFKNTIEELKEKIEFVNDTTWELLDILSKIPWITFENKERYLPQMINLDKLKAVSFKKGCFTGQEVIARIHYRGRVKRCLELIKSKYEMHAGCHLYLKNTGKKVGEILNSSYKIDDAFFGLAVIESDKLDNELFVDRLEKEKINIIP